MSISPTLPRLSHKVPPSSRRWLERQYRDPLVRQRLNHPANYRSRSAFKLLEIEQQWKFLRPNDVRVVVDLGAAPGGWSQVVAGKMGWTIGDVVGTREMRKTSAAPVGDAAEQGFGLAMRRRAEKYGSWSSPANRREEVDENEELDEEEIDIGKPGAFDVELDAHAERGRATIVAVDLLPIWPLPGVKTLQMDFLSPEADSTISALIGDNGTSSSGTVDVILCDMAANFSGNRVRDIESSLDICNKVFEFTERHLRTSASVGRYLGGVLLLKHFTSPEAQLFRQQKLEPNFGLVRYLKPDSSRSESSEGYWLCMGWKANLWPDKRLLLSKQPNRKR